MHKGTGKVTDIYTKLGDSGAYGGMLAIIPDYDAGFSFLNAYYEPMDGPQTRGTSALKIINLIAEAVVPALEAQAAVEAKKNFAGTYVSFKPDVESKLVVTFNQSDVEPSASSLNIQKWISNGTDMVEVQFGGTKPRLLLSIPEKNSSNDRGQVTFQLSSNPQWETYAAAGLGRFTGFYDSNFDWAVYDGPRYAGGGLNTFTFDVDEVCSATSVTNGATRQTLRRA